MHQQLQQTMAWMYWKDLLANPAVRKISDQMVQSTEVKRTYENKEKNTTVYRDFIRLQMHNAHK